MRFQVPQYIEIEDKIFGPLTFKQFVYVAGGVGISFVIYSLINSFILSMLFILPVMILSGMLAFYQYNNKPFVYLLEAFFYYIISDKLYIWKKKPKEIKKISISPADISNSHLGIQKVNTGTIRDLSMKLDMVEKEEKVSDRL